jgi:hypothetical protein
MGAKGEILDFKRVSRMDLVRLVVYYRSLVKASHTLVKQARAMGTLQPFDEFTVNQQDWEMAESMLIDLGPEIEQVKAHYDAQH